MLAGNHRVPQDEETPSRRPRVRSNMIADENEEGSDQDMAQRPEDKGSDQDMAQSPEDEGSDQDMAHGQEDEGSDQDMAHSQEDEGSDQDMAQSAEDEGSDQDMAHGQEDEDEDDDGFGPMTDNEDERQVQQTASTSLPQEIVDAETEALRNKSCGPERHEIHRRYTGFLKDLCANTSTQDAYEHTMAGLPYTVCTAKSIDIGEHLVHGGTCDMFAFALVIHVWQLSLLRLQHGTYPNPSLKGSLSLNWGSYTTSAYYVVNECYQFSTDKLDQAVRYWERRLKVQGKGNNWLKQAWTKDIEQQDQSVRHHRNEIADAYLKTLDTHGLVGLAMKIIKEEKNGEETQLRVMAKEGAESKGQLIRLLSEMLLSVDHSFLCEIIQGRIPQKAFTSFDIQKALQRIGNNRYAQPSTYLNSICDYMGASPTPAQWGEVCNLMLKYVQRGDPESNQLAAEIDRAVHPLPGWSAAHAERGLRRYTGSNAHRAAWSLRRKNVRYFVDQLRLRIQGLQEHAPLEVPVIEIGFSNNPRRRLRQHRHHKSSNYLMNLAQAAFEYQYRGDFKLQQHVIYKCFDPSQVWLSEIVFTQLAQGYVKGGCGFSHEPAGRSNTSNFRKIADWEWSYYRNAACREGNVERKIKEEVANGEKAVDPAERALEEEILQLEIEKLEADIALTTARRETLEAFTEIEETSLSTRRSPGI